MTNDQLIKRVKEIMQENEINYTKAKEMEMAVVYAQARVDLSKENLDEINKITKGK